MYRIIRSSTLQNENVLKIYVDIPDDSHIEAASSSKKSAFTNYDAVKREITNHLITRGFTILKVKPSDNDGSASSYYHTEIIAKKREYTVFVFFRISDHNEDNSESAIDRRNYHYRGEARKYSGISKEDLDDAAFDKDRWRFVDIVIDGKPYRDFNRAISRAKQRIDEFVRVNDLE